MARARLVQAKWTERILDELDRSLAKREIPEEKRRRLRQLINGSVADRVVYACVQQIVDERVNPPETIDDVLGQLERSGLIEAAAALRLG